MKAIFMINKYGHEGHYGIFATITAARKGLTAMKKQDKIDCRTKTRIPKVTSTKDSYKIEFGCNLWSAAAINRYPSN